MKKGNVLFFLLSIISISCIAMNKPQKPASPSPRAQHACADNECQCNPCTCSPCRCGSKNTLAPDVAQALATAKIAGTPPTIITIIPGNTQP